MIRREIFKDLITITDEEQHFLDGGKDIDRSIYMDSGSVVSRKKLLSEGKLITVRPHTRFVHFPEHTHDYVEMIYMCSGSTTHIINGETVKLSEGELLMLSQNARQEVLPAGGNDIAVNFIVLPEFFDNTLMMLGDEETPLRTFVVNCLKNSSSGFSGYLRFEVADVLPVQNLVENLIWTLIHGSPNKRKINQYTMGLLFLQLLNYTDKLSYSSRRAEAVMKVLSYIEHNFKNGSLQELANELHYDFCWLSREIKRKTGKTYTELVQDKRLSRAQFLLKNTDLNISDIAMQVGYDNVSYFHRLFRRNFGVSPKNYRVNQQKP